LIANETDPFGFIIIAHISQANNSIQVDGFMKNASSFVKDILSVSFYTFLSRIAGLIRDSVMAALFGAGLVSDAFNAAFVLPNMFRRLLAEGAMSIAFIPVFTEYQNTQTPEETKRLYNVTYTHFFVILLFVTILGTIFSPTIVKLFNHGFSAEKLALTDSLNRLMFSFIFFVGLNAFQVGIMNSLRQFNLPAAMPIVLNFCNIICALSLYHVLEKPIFGAAIGVIVGGILPIFILGAVLRRQGIKVGFAWDLGHPAVRKMLALMGPATFGIAVYQINLLVSQNLASRLSDGSVTYIYLSNRFLELPLGIFAVSISTVSLPNLAQYIAQKNFKEFCRTYSFSLILSFLVCIPAMIWLIVLRVPVFSCLLQRGSFSYHDTVMLGDVFLMASLGIWAVGGSRISVPAFYSMQNTRTPVIIAFFSFIINAALSAYAVLGTNLGAKGLTLANSVSSTFNFAVLIYCLQKQVGAIEGQRIIRTTVKILVASIIMGVSVYPVSCAAIWPTPGHIVAKGMLLGLAMLIGGLVFSGLAFILKIEGIAEVLAKLRRRLKRPSTVEQKI
jgi:putative peptidoglycan lipid II flippase